MNACCTAETVRTVLAAPGRWRENFQGEDYRRERLERWQLLGPFKRADVSVRYVTDRVAPGAEALDLWLLHLWLFAAGGPSHALLGFVVPAGVDGLARPQAAGPLDMLRVNETGAGGAHAGLRVGSAPELAQLVVLQLIAPDRVFRHKPLLPSVLPDRSWQGSAVIDIWQPDRALLAQLLLLAVRQGVDDGSC